MILVSIPGFFGGKKHIKIITNDVGLYMQHKNPIWRQKWPPKPQNDRKSITIDSNVMILMCTPMFWGARNTLRPLKMKVVHYLTG